MASDLRSIGEMARATGLTVSALRFYDGAGILVPAAVDPATGYRWYAEEQLPPARLLASLRRVGLPLADVSRVLDRWSVDPAAVHALLDAHLHRLESDLANARRELALVHALLDREPAGYDAATVRRSPGGRFDLDIDALRAALDAVRFAVGRDPRLPTLHGVLFDAAPHTLRLVATDRYRLAVAEVPVGTTSGPTRRILAPVGFVDAARALLDRPGSVTLELSPRGIRIRGASRGIDGEPLARDFPDYHRLLPPPGRRRVTVDSRRLRGALRSAPTRRMRRAADGAATDVAVLTVDAAGNVAVASQSRPPGSTGPERSRGDVDADGQVIRIGVNRDFMVEALDATGDGPLALEFDGPLGPLTVGRTSGRRIFSLLMPVRL